MPQPTPPNRKLEALKKFNATRALEAEANKLSIELRDILRRRGSYADQNAKTDNAVVEIVVRAWCVRDRLPQDLQDVREQILQKALHHCVSYNQHLIWNKNDIEVGPGLIELFCFAIRNLLDEE